LRNRARNTDPNGRSKSGNSAPESQNMKLYWQNARRLKTAIKDSLKLTILNDTLNKNLALVNKFSQRRHELEMFVERESQTLTREHALLQSKVAELEKSAHGLPKLKEEARQAQNQLQHLAAEEEILRNKREASQETIAQVRSMESDKDRLEKELTENRRKIETIADSTG